MTDDDDSEIINHNGQDIKNVLSLIYDESDSSISQVSDNISVKLAKAIELKKNSQLLTLNQPQSQLNQNTTKTIIKTDSEDYQPTQVINIKRNKDKADKIKKKKEQLEQRIQQRLQIIEQLENQCKENQDDINLIERNLLKKEEKRKQLEKGNLVSESDSIISSFNLPPQIEKALERLHYLIYNNIKVKKMQFFAQFMKKAKSSPSKDQSAQKQNPLDKKFTRRGTLRLTKRQSIQRYQESIIEDENNDIIIPDQSVSIDNKNDTSDPILFTEGNENNNNINNEEDINNLHVHVLEYDKFYKEQFFKDELFRKDYPPPDKEDVDISKDIKKQQIKKLLRDKQKIKEIIVQKNQNTKQIDKEINALKNEYETIKQPIEKGVELYLNNTDKMMQKGRELDYYFSKEKGQHFPKFSVHNEKELKGKEIIDFKEVDKKELIRRKYDKYPCLKCRKKIYKVMKHIEYYCCLIVDNVYFDYLSLVVIITNTILILVSDPRDDNSIANKSDQFFLYFYTLEAILKILGFGFVCTERAYLKDYWNILDFFVIIVGWISFILERVMNGTKISGLAGLRAFRILRPLKTIKSIKVLRRLIIALLASLAKLKDITIVLFFFFLLFAIAGVQMWQGLFMRRCMNLQYGFMYSLTKDKGMCTFDSDCQEYNTPGNSFICAKGYRNPDNNIVCFDNVLKGFITVFIMITLEGWTDVWNYVSNTFKDKFYINPVITFIFFHLYIFIGGFYLMNLFLAVTNSEFNNIGKTRKQLLEKPSLLALFKSKYDLEEKEKIERKKRLKELEKKNQGKTEDDITDLKIKIEDEAYKIERNPKKIPTLYTTINDMSILQNSNPEELYQIDQMIEEEEKFLKNDIKQQLKDLDALAEQRKNKKHNSLDEEDEYGLTSFSNKKKEKQIEITRKRETIYNSIIKIAMNYTCKAIRSKVRQLEQETIPKKTDIFADLKKHKLERKEIEKYNMNQLSLKEDLSFEEEIRLNREKNEMKYREHHAKEAKNQKLKQHKSNTDEFKSNSNQKNIIKLREKKNVRKIAEDISFINELSVSSEDQTKTINNNDMTTSVINCNSFDGDSSILKSNNNVSELILDNTMLNKGNNISYNTKSDDTKSKLSDLNTSYVEQKVFNIEDNNNITNTKNNHPLKTEIKFTRPQSLLPQILELKQHESIKRKLNKLREQFQINKFLNYANLEGAPISSLGQRKSFLQFMRNDDEFQLNNNIVNDDVINEVTNELAEGRQLDFLKEKDNSLSISSVSLSDASVFPNSIVEGNEVHEEEMNMNELEKMITGNKIMYKAKDLALDSNANETMHHLTSLQKYKFYKKTNHLLNDNLTIGTRLPRKRELDTNERSHLFLLEQFQRKNDENKISSINMNNRSNVKLKKKNNNLNEEKKQNDKINEERDANIALLYKSPSIEKNLHKYPLKDSEKLFVPEKNEKLTSTLTPQQELITDNWRSRKYYMNYLYNIKEKDLKVKDDFKMDIWKEDILGKDENVIPRKKLPESNEAVFVFNDKQLKLKRYKFLTNKLYEYKDEECAMLTNNLKSFPISILELMPPRMRDFGKYAVGKEIQLGGLSVKSTSKRSMASSSRMNLMNSYSTLNNSALVNHSRSGLTMSTMTAINLRGINEEMKYKRGIYDKIFRKIDDFNYKTLTYYFLDDDKVYLKLADDLHKENKRKELLRQNREKQDVLEVKSSVENIRVYDIRTNSTTYVQWSGQDVLYMLDLYKDDKQREKYNEMINSLENFGVIIWKRAPCIKQLQKIQYGLYVLSISQIFDFFILAVVLANSIIMAMDGNIFTPEKYRDISISNYVFNSIFIAEFVIKFIGLGPIIYFSDPFTYLDLFIIVFAVVDMASPSTDDVDTIGTNKSVTAQLGFLRVFRIFRVLRLTKLLRKLKSMRLILSSIQTSVVNILYILMIIIMFWLIFQLLGMSLLNGNLRYRSFMISFYTTFEILTKEGWQSIFYEMYSLHPCTFFYFLIWIFFGNYILFNLLISIVLQSFDNTQGEEKDDLEMIEKAFLLPDYLYQLKQFNEHQNKNFSEFKIRKINKNDNINLSNTAVSQTQTKMSGLSKSNLSVSKSENNETSSHFLSQSNLSMGDDDNEDDEQALTGIDKMIKHWGKVNELFKKNECEKSLYIFSQINVFRVWCMKLVSNKKFEWFILALIILSTLRLVIGTIVKGYTVGLAFDIIDLVFNFIFTLEMIFKVIALGFVMDEGSYIRDNWNKIDLIIVVVSLIDIDSIVQKYSSSGNKSSSFNFLKVLRLLRTLRPLRFISHNVQLKLLISSLFDSILPIINALIIVLVVLFMFSIVGINLFYNLYHNCYVPGHHSAFKLADNAFSDNLIEYEIPNNMISIMNFCEERYNGIMDTGPTFKFDNIYNSLISSYVLGTMEGWPEIMDEYRVYNEFYGIFFIVYLLIVSYFFLNIFTGIMFKYFNDAWTREKRIRENDKKANKYYDFLNQLELAEPAFNSYLAPEEGTIKYTLIQIALSKALDNFIMIIIFLNMVIMAMSYEGCSPGYQLFLDIVNYIFTGIFILECAFKIIALGPTYYFYFGWNIFDFFVVVASIADLIVTNIEGIDTSFLKSFQIIRVLRVLRVTRVLRLFRSLKSLEKLIQTLRWAISALSNVFILMFLIFCIFSILGCYLYETLYYINYKDELTYMNKYYNFDNFYNSFLLVFRCATGEKWHLIMMELAYLDDFSNIQAYIYMIIMNFFSYIIMLNLFLMVTLQQYDEFTNKTYNPLDTFESFITEFRNSWNKYSDSRDKGFRIKKMLIQNFFVDFTWKKLNFPETNKLEHIKKYILELELRTDQENYVYFHDVMLKVAIKQLGAKVDRTVPENQIIGKLEKKIGAAFKTKITDYINKHVLVKGKNPLNTFNPLTSHLYYKASYVYIKTFINYYRDNSDLIGNEIKNTISNEDESESESNSSRMKNDTDNQGETEQLISSRNDNIDARDGNESGK